MARRILLAALVAVMPGAALAADRGATLALLDEGIDGCFATIGEEGKVTHDYMFDGYGWEGDADPEMGLGFLYPPSGDDPFITVALDGSFCQVESMTIDSATASEHLRAALDAAGQEVEYDKDEMGCTRLNLGAGYAVTITSGGQDPICGSETDSALRFTFE